MLFPKELFLAVKPRVSQEAFARGIPLVTLVGDVKLLLLVAFSPMWLLQDGFTCWVNGV